jgi:hypothetical protein
MGKDRTFFKYLVNLLEGVAILGAQAVKLELVNAGREPRSGSL